MLTFSWNAAYESSPTQTASRSLIDDFIRQIARGVRERMSREHNFGYTVEGDDGTHRPGRTTIALRGDEATRDALVDVQQGAVYARVGAGGELWLDVYHDAFVGWDAVTDDDHGSLTGRSADDHPQYLRLNESITDLAAVINMGGNFLTLAQTPIGCLRVSPHIFDVHPLTDIDALRNGILAEDHLRYTHYWAVSINDYRLGPLGRLAIPVPTNLAAIISIYFVCVGNPGDVEFGCATDGGTMLPNVAIMNNTIVDRYVTLRIWGIRSLP